MTDSIDELRLKVAKAFDGVEFPGNSTEEMQAFFTEKLALFNVTSNVGWILHAGTVWDGAFQVQFNIPGDGWSSRWPEWAFQAARDALLHDKKIWVISDGPPFGAKILLALVTNSPV